MYAKRSFYAAANGLFRKLLNSASEEVILELVRTKCKVKGKVFPYSLPSVGPGADPGVQAVSPQVT